MKKTKILANPVRIADLSLEDFSDDELSNSALRMERIHMREWRKLKQQAI